MTRILAFLSRLYADIQHNNRLAAATHRTRNHVNNPPMRKRGR
jgi:hypothetical protein